MNVFFTLLPVYLMGNVHCLGMCGPIAMILAHSPYRIFYLLGRLMAFTLAGGVAGSLGEVIGAFLALYHLSSIFSIFFGLILIAVALNYVVKNKWFKFLFLEKIFHKLQHKLSLFIHQNEPWPLFLVGFLTIFLPCGQTLLVFSAIALSANTIVGIMNGFAFGLLTTPSLLLAMQARHVTNRLKKWYEPALIFSSCLVGLLAVLRGFAELGLIDHIGIKHFIIY